MSQGDMFLKIEGARQGPIKGEAHDDKHADEIDVLGWSWGMRAATELGGGGASARSTVNQLNVVKKVDRASTALMASLRNNELIKSAVLTIRKAGQNPLEYVVIGMQKVRLTALEVFSGEPGEGAELTEKLSLAFQKISVTYVPQGPDGQPRGAMTFETEID